MTHPDDYPHTPQSLHSNPVDFGHYLNVLADQDVFDSPFERMLAMYQFWCGGKRRICPDLSAEPSIERYMYGFDDLGLVAAFTWPGYVDDLPRPYSLNELRRRTDTDVRAAFKARVSRFQEMAEDRGLDYRDIWQGTDALMQTRTGLPLGVDLDHIRQLSSFAGIIYDPPSLLGRVRHPHLDRLQSDIAVDWTRTAAAATVAKINWSAHRMLLEMGNPAEFHRDLPSPPPADSKYHRLFERLDTDDSPEVSLTISQVDRVLRGPDRRAIVRAGRVAKRVGHPEQGADLPTSARSRRSWWANRTAGSSRQTLQSRAWQAAGYNAEDIQLGAGNITFRPKQNRDLWQLVRKTLRTLTSEQLADMDLTERKVAYTNRPR